MGRRRRKHSTPKAQEMDVGDALTYAVELHKARQLDAAEELYERILAAAPNHPDLLHFLGVLSHQRGRSDSAITLIQRAIDAQPDYVDAHNNLGNVLKECSRFAEAENSYRQAIALKPDSPLGYNNLGIILKVQNRFGEAIQAYEKAIAIDPHFAHAYRNLGNILRKQGKVDESLTAYRKAIELAPYNPDSYKKLGRALSSVGRLSEAVEVYDEWLRHDPGNPIAEHMKAACAATDVPERASDACVVQTFDSFAASFDQVLQLLEYRAPLLVSEAIEEALGAPDGTLEVLDAGCGTGLSGVDLRPYARRLSGVDLSSAMLDKASGRDVYDELIAAELTAFMEDHPDRYDLIASADTLCYFGALDSVLAAAATALRAGGWLVFTLEHDDAEEGSNGFRINPHGRYSHSEYYIRRSLNQTGLALAALATETLRSEGGEPVAGLVISARRIAET